MTAWQMDVMTLRELIEAYGSECRIGGQGHTGDDSDELFTEIEKRIKAAEEDGGGAL